MEAKHTPGPWRVEADKVEVGAEVGFRPFGACGCCDSPWMNADDPAVAKADARLIAAAPDLLEALQAVLRSFPTDGDMRAAGWEQTEIDLACRDYEAARAAIAKATQ